MILRSYSCRLRIFIDLCHPDIRNTSHSKMPLHLNKLKSLHVLVGAKFLLGAHSGSRMEDLGELHNLYGSLSIVELKNVVDRREALKVNMREMLLLKWSGSLADNSKNEKYIFLVLRPDINIKELHIS